ncbi:MAG: VWA domain-containing protein [Candidatus Pacearchaeota archaeon]
MKKRVVEYNLKKRSQANVIVLILIILLILFLLIILWNIIMALLRQNQSVIDLKRDLMRIDIRFNEGPQGEGVDPSIGGGGRYVDLRVTRGSDDVELIGQKEVEVIYNSPADIFSLVDMTGSMYISEKSSCVGISTDEYCNLHPNACCCQINPLTGKRLDCSKPDDCRKCNFGEIKQDPVTGENICIFSYVAPYRCWNEQENKRYDFTTEDGCQKCGDRLASQCSWNFVVENAQGQPVTITIFDEMFLGNDLDKCKAAGGDEIRSITLEIGGTNSEKRCIVTTGNNGRCKNTPENCLTKNSCEYHNGEWRADIPKDPNNPSSLGVCVFSHYFPRCCSEIGGLGSCTKNQNICNTCGGSFEYLKDSNENNLCRFFNGIIGSTTCSGKYYFKQHGSASMERLICENDYCKGNLRAKRRIDYAKEASLKFIDKVFDLSTEHRLGLVNYSDDLSIFSDSSGNVLIGSDKKDLLKNRVNEWILTETLANSIQNTNICKALKDSAEKLSSISNDPDRYKAIVLMTDGKSNTFCNGVRITDNSLMPQVNEEIISLAKNIFENKKIHIYVIGAGDPNDIDNSLLQEIANKADGAFVFSENVEKLNELYDQIAYKISKDILKFYKSKYNFDYLKSVVMDNNGKTCISRIDELINPLETKRLKVPICDLEYDSLKSIEIYLIAHTNDGKEVEKLLDRWEK